MESMLSQNGSPPEPDQRTKARDTTSIDVLIQHLAMEKKMAIRVLYAPLQIPQVRLEQQDGVREDIDVKWMTRRTTPSGRVWQ